MNFAEELAALRARIAKAESERDTWRTSGMQDNYLADAVNYARLQRSLPPGGDEAGPPPPAQNVDAPDASQRRLMAASAITFRDGVYHLGAYRYDRLADAVNYARLQLSEET